MSSDPPRLFDLWEVDDDCQDKLRKTKNAIENGNRQVRQIARIVERCADSEPSLALETIDELIQSQSILPSRIRRGLQAISQADQSMASSFFDDAIDNEDYDQDYIAGYAAHLFWNDVSEFCDQLEEWYSSHPRFFEQVVEQTLGEYHEIRQSEKELGNKEDRLLDTLIDIAEEENVDVSGAISADIDDKLVKSSLILDDLRYFPSNLETYGISVNHTRIETNSNDYPELTDLLGENWHEKLESEGSYELPILLSHEIDRKDFYSRRRSMKESQDIDDISKQDLSAVAKLSYLNHCCEIIDTDDESTRSLRQALLDREKYVDGLAELDVINALRREFVDKDTTIEPTINEKEPDFSIELDERRLWIEITNARESTEKRLRGVFSAPSGEDSKVRDKVTQKTRGQISAIKEECPDDLTMVVLKNEFSAIDDHLVREYALGGLMLMVDQNSQDPDVYAVPGKPIAVEDEYEGDPEDEGIEHLDILVNYSYTVDFYTKPYLTGQVFVFSESVGEKLLNRIAEAFNADSTVYMTPFAEDE